MNTLIGRLLLLVWLQLGLISDIHAQAWPSKPIRSIVPFSAGGSTDLISRKIGERLSAALGQQVITDNRPGGASVIGTDQLAKAAADGYTMGLLISTHALNPFVMKSLPYDSIKDFIPVTLAAVVPVVLTVNPSVPVSNLGELIALAKAKPGTLNYGQPGSLSNGHLSMELLKNITGTNIVSVPYKGGIPALADLVAGQIQVMMNAPSATIPFIKAGKLKALAVSGAKRMEAMPEIPTIAESGYPGFETYDWFGYFVPAKTPHEIVTQLNREIAQIVKSPQISAWLMTQGAVPVGNTPEEFVVFLQAEMEKLGGLARKIGLRAE